MPHLLGTGGGGQDQHRVASEGQKVLPIQDGPNWASVERAEEQQGGVIHPDPRPHCGG